jgi:adenylate cyclase
LEIVERNRVKKYKEEEAERARLMEDIIRLYEKIKSQDGNTNEIEKKINYINDRVAKFKVMTDRRPLSPKQAEALSDYASITPGRMGETAS